MVHSEILNSNKFPLQPMGKNYVVTWPDLIDTRDIETNFIRNIIPFLQSETIGLLLLDNEKQFNTVWINKHITYMKQDYIGYIENMYIIKGLVFNNKTDAEILQDQLYKKYMWHIIKK